MSDNVQLSDQAQAEPGPALKQEKPPEMTDDTPRTPGIQAPALPAPPRQGEKVPVHLERLAETARDYARGAKAAATQRAYAADWRHYTAWCRRRELEPLPPDPQVVGLYLAASDLKEEGSAGYRRSRPPIIINEIVNL
jgi:hypothetical protein